MVLAQTPRRTGRLDRIVQSALTELAAAHTWSRAHEPGKLLALLGSARIERESAEYRLARELASQFVAEGWRIMTGAGPGTMAAGLEGAGPESSLGVSIRLPFEPASAHLLDPGRLLSVEHFFVRKLLLLYDADAFACLPGGFGTMDEVWELLVLQQTGKLPPTPVILLAPPGSAYWNRWDAFVREEIIQSGFASPPDSRRYVLTDSLSVAADHVQKFYGNYHSLRYDGGRLILRLRRALNERETRLLNEQFSARCAVGAMSPAGPTPAELADDDVVTLPRLAFEHTPQHAAHLHELIMALDDPLKATIRGAGE